MPENFEFDILEGNNLRFNKISYHELVISAIYNQTLKVINIDESGNAVISKISIKPKNEFGASGLSIGEILLSLFEQQVPKPSIRVAVINIKKLFMIFIVSTPLVFTIIHSNYKCMSTW